MGRMGKVSGASRMAPGFGRAPPLQAENSLFQENTACASSRAVGPSLGFLTPEPRVLHHGTHIGSVGVLCRGPGLATPVNESTGRARGLFPQGLSLLLHGESSASPCRLRETHAIPSSRPGDIPSPSTPTGRKPHALDSSGNATR